MTTREALITNYTSRMHCQPLKIQPRLVDLVPQKLMQRVNNEFYNPRVLEVAMCVIFAIFGDTKSDIPINERIKYWFRDLEQIGTESLEGYAMRADLGFIKDSLILKAPRDPRNNELAHELFIGLYGTNPLRTVLPNFAYLFGLFACTFPIIEPKTKVVGGTLIKKSDVRVVSFCEKDSTKKVPYIIYENIAPAIPMKEYVATCTGEEFMLVYLQVILALRIAWKTTKFVHNDLHYENVLIRQVPETFSIPYLTPWGARYITSNRVATIIDFGRSHIEYKGVHYGFKGNEVVGVFEDFPLPILDAYKLLLYCIAIMIKVQNWDAYDRAKLLVAYFHPEIDPGDIDFDSQIDEIVDDAREFYYFYFALASQEIPDFREFIEESKGVITSDYPDKWLFAFNFDYDDYLQYISTNCQCTFLTDKPQARLAHCHGQQCGDRRQILHSFFDTPFSQAPTPEDFFGFYDLYTNKNASEAFRDFLKLRFDPIYKQARNKYALDVVSEVSSFRDTVMTIDPAVTLLNMDYTAITNIADEYRERFTQIADAMDKWQSFTFLFEVGHYVANVYNDIDLEREINKLNEKVKTYHFRIVDYLYTLMLDRIYWEELLKTPAIAKKIKGEPKLNWLRLVFPDALGILIGN